MFFETHFSTQQVTAFTVAGGLALLSLVLFSRKRNGMALFALAGAAAVLRLMMIAADDFLHTWDEQFHALVAKNMMSHPFKPMLYEHALLPYDYTFWSRNHIWLHKQPLFLWQMALSMKMFGASVWSVRLPSAVMSVMLVPVIYRMGKNIVNMQTGYFAAFLFTFSFIMNEVVSGSMAGDHNDVAFLFYVTLSVWCWTEYRQHEKAKWIFLIGIFSGIAILVKWMPGLLVYAGWGVSTWRFSGSGFRIKKWKPMLLSLGICLLVFLPWQIYIHYAFPAESTWERSMYHAHFMIPVDGHGGSWYYQFAMLPFLYGTMGVVLIVAGLIWQIRKMINDKSGMMNIPGMTGTMTMIVIVYLFYSVCATKMELFCLPVAPLLFIMAGSLLADTWTYLCDKGRWYFSAAGFILAIFAGTVFLQVHTLELRHTDLDTSDFLRTERKINTARYKQMIAGIRSEKYCIVGLPELDAHIVMFYSGMPAYGRAVTELEKRSIEKQGYKVIEWKTLLAP